MCLGAPSLFHGWKIAHWVAAAKQRLWASHPHCELREEDSRCAVFQLYSCCHGNGKANVIL